ncbi:MAG: hypothetical protein ACR2PO_14060 [Methyloligellaceae bacterium]
MTATVDVYFRSGMISLAVNSTDKPNFDSTYVHAEPYLGLEQLSAGASAVTSSAAPAETAYAQVNVQPGRKVRYEVNGLGRSVDAMSSSPMIFGETLIALGAGQTLSVIEDTT